MNEIIKYEQVRDSIITLRGQQVILDSDVARLYGVETKRVNEAVRNNPEKFPEGFLIHPDNQEVADLRSKISTASIQEADNQPNSIKFAHRNQFKPTAFTESGLYMLATILKSPRATQTTIAIIKAFVQLRELSRTMQAVAKAEKEEDKKSLLQRSGELIGDILGTQFETTSTETEIELNLAMIKIKHTVKREKKDDDK